LGNSRATLPSAILANRDARSAVNSRRIDLL
jgi:hypothetical protein